ncbi:putative Ig domain-containing protein [Spirosoma pomorum]
MSGIANATVSVLGANGLLNVNIPTVPSGTNTLTVSLSLAGVQVATVPISVTGIDVIVPATNLASAVVGTALTLGTCPVGNPLSYTLANGTIGTGNLTFAANLSGQSVTIACQGSPCPPATITLPTVSLPSLTQPVLAPICAGQPLSFSVGIANIGNNLPSLLTASVSGIANATVSVLGANGLLNVNIPTVPSGTNTLTVSLSLAGVQVATVPISVTGIDAIVPATNLASAVVGTALTLGTCPVGNPLSYTLADGTIGTGNLTFAANLSGQSVTIACQGSPCPPATVVLPTVGLLTLNLGNIPTSVCVDLPINLNVLPTPGVSLSLVTITASTTSGTLAVSALGPNGALSINGGQLTVGNNQPITLTARVAGVAVASATFNINVTQPAVPNQPLPGSLTATVGSVLSLTGLCPTGILVNASDLTNLTGIINIPTTTAGVQSLSVLCNDNGCLSPIRVVTTTVVPALIGLLTNSPICLNQPLSLTVIPTNLTLGDPLLNVTVTGPAGLTASALDGNGVLTVTGLVSGINNLTVTASLAGVPVASATVQATVVPVPDPVAVASLTVLEGTTLSLTALCPTGVVSTSGLGGITPLLSLPPTTVGVQVLPILCAGQNTTCVSPVTSVTVITVPLPTIGITPSSLQVCVGDPLSLTVTGLGAITGPIGLSLVGPPSSIVGISGNVITVNGLPSGTATLTVNAGITVAGIAAVVSQTVTVTVLGVPAPPTVVTQAGQPYPANVSSLSVNQNSASVLFNASCTSGTLSYTSNTGLVGSASVITVPTTATGVFSYSAVCTNGACISPTTVASVTVVTPANLAPVLSQSLTSPVNATVGVGVNIPTAYAFSDPNGDPLSFSSPNLPAALTINPATGVITGAPSASGTYGITIVATDPAGLSATGSFTLNVVPQPPVNVAPVLSQSLTSPVNATVGVGVNIPTAYAFSDPNGDPLSFSSPNLPAALTINPATGVITGAPSASGTYGITIVATDPSGLSATGSFTLNVVPANAAPVLSQSLTSPVNATVGVGVNIPTAYAFSDPNGDPLSFSSPNLPAALTINPATGVVTGAPSASGTYGITIVATDPAGLSATGSFTLNVVPANAAPVLSQSLTSPVNATVGVGVNIPTAYAFSDPNGDPLNFSSPNLPAALTINPATGVITGAPSASGTYGITIVATDPAGLSATGSFTLNVVPQPPVNVAPVLSQSLTSPVNATVGVGVNIPTAYAFSDPNGDPLSFSSPNLPAALTINPATGVITGAPSASGTYGITIVATDPAGLSATGSFTLNVVPANAAPVLSQSLTSPVNATVGVGVNIPTAYAFSDPNGDPLSFSSPNLPAALTINPATGVITGAPSASGTYGITIVATDPSGLSATGSFTLNVVPANAAPVLSQSLTSPVNATVGVGVNIPTAYAFSDPNGDPLSFSSPNLPAALTINPATGVITGAPSASGTYGITIVATDPAGLSATGSFTLNVVPANAAPVLSQSLTSPVNATVGVGVNIPTAYAFSDPNGDPLSFSSPNLPAALTINPATGVITGAPSASGTYGITIVATDPAGLSATGSFTLNVVPQPPVNVAPVLSQSLTSPVNATVGVGVNIPTAYAFSDPNGDPLSFSSPNLPTALSINAATGQITGAPSASGTYGITIVATDPAGLSATGSFTLNVVPANAAPVLSQSLTSPVNATVGVGVNIPTAYAFSDPNGDPLSFSSPNLPAALTINPATGVITGAPSASGTYGITIVATDPSGLSASGSFTLNVVPANAAPVLSQSLTSPVNATVGVGVNIPTAYAFSDPNGDPLSFSSPNLPTALSINAATGQITGAPSASGTYGITIVATDPAGLSATGSFTLNVVPQPPVNVAPVLSQSLTSPVNATVGVGVNIPTAYAFSDPNGDPLSFSSPNLPTALVINPTTGIITGAPSASGTYGITIVATDPAGLSATGSFTLNVVPANAAPVLSQSLTSPVNATVGVGVNIPTAYAFSDPNGDPLSFSSPNLPAALTINPATGVITGAPSASGTYGITIVATDPAGLSATGSFTLNVVPQPPVNVAPVLSQSLTSPVNATVGVGVNIPTAYAFSDPNGDPLSFSSPNLPTALVINPATGLITGTPSASGTYGITIVATDPAGLSATGSFTLNVVPANAAPVLSQSLTSPVNATVGVGVNIPTAYAFSDPNGDPLSFSSPNLPAALTINPATGVITGAPSASGTYGITIVATDPAGLSATGSFTLNVVPANAAPVLSQSLTSPVNATVGVGVNIPTAYAFSDPNGDPLNFSSPNLPAALTINPATGVITGAPSASGTYGITIVATDPAGLSATGSFTLNVVPAQTTPFAIVGVTPINCQTVTAGLRTFTFSPIYAGLNGQPVLFSVVNELVPTYASGPYTLNLYTDNPVITLRAEQGSSVSTFTLNWLTICTGGTGNQPPVVANPIGPQSGTVGVGVNFPIPGNTFTDPNGDPITVTVINLPPGLTFDPSTTAIVGTPTTPGTTTVTVIATDPSSATVSTQFPFTIVPATPGNQAPIVVNPIPPQSGTVGVGFTFVIPGNTFQDPNGDPLTVSVSNLPPGLTFNPSTTAITGTPTAPGTTVVTVTATDPSNATASTTFVLTIRPAVIQPPLNCGSNLDGTPLRATMPIYDCEQIRTTGLIQFTAEGGNPNGGPIEFLAYGITGWTTSCTETIDLETRTFCDAPPIEIQIRQLVNGTYVYGQTYIFDIRRVCPAPGCPRPSNNRTPVVNAGIPDQYARVGQIFDYDIQPNAFSDPDGDALLYTISPRLPDSFTYSTGHFHALPLEPATYNITVMARDNSGAAVITTFRIFVLPSNETTPQPPVTTPQPPVTPPVSSNCGSSSLDGTALRATTPIYDCAQLTTTGALRFTATGGNPNGGAVEFRAVGVTDWTTNCNVTLDQGIRTACDAAPVPIQVRQLVNGTYVYGQTFLFNIRQACPIAGCANARVAAPVYAEMPLEVTVLGNPVEGESAQIEIRGAEGKSVRMLMTNSSGYPVSDQVIENAQATERQTLKLGATGGVYLLRVSTPTQVKTVKVVKQ